LEIIHLDIQEDW